MLNMHEWGLTNVKMSLINTTMYSLVLTESPTSIKSVCQFKDLALASATN